MAMGWPKGKKRFNSISGPFGARDSSPDLRGCLKVGMVKRQRKVLDC